MANVDEEDIIEDDSFRTVLSFSPEVQEAIDQVIDKMHIIFSKVGVALVRNNRRRSRFVTFVPFHQKSYLRG